jgi:penicillin-binding protein 2
MMRLPPIDRGRRWRSETRAPRGRELFQRRFLLLKALIILLFGVLLLQLVRMQIVDHDHYSAQANSNRLRTVPVLPARGLIYDRNGVQLVSNQPIFSAAVVPADVPKDKVLEVVAGLSLMTGVPPQDIANKIASAKLKDPQTPLVIKPNIDDATAFKLREQQSSLPGVQVLVESVRKYPDGTEVSDVLGFVGRIDEAEYNDLKNGGYQLNDHLGKTGVEYTYESALRGTPGYDLEEVDATGKAVKTVASVPPLPAGNLVLSLDLDLQKHVTQFLQAGLGSSQNAAAVVLDVHTGEILSLVSLPSYDSNILTEPIDENKLDGLLNDPNKPMLNHAISEVNPPGSTFKMVTGSAALQEGVASPSTTITSNGSLTVQDEYTAGKVWVMKDWAVLGTMDFYHGLAMSSDVYFYYLSGGYYRDGVTVFQGLGADRLARYARDYGFGAKTGIDIPGEAAGNVPDPAWKEQTVGEVWTLGDTYNFGIGQGYLTVTPMQLIRVTAAIANGGDLPTPHVAKEVVDAQGHVVQSIAPPPEHKIMVSPDNLAIMREAMRQAVVYGPARTGASRNVTIAGKTGTAEFGEQTSSGTYVYSHAWYTGYAPIDNPQVAVLVYLEKGIGATNAGPVAKQIFDYYFGRQHLAQAQQP